MGSIGEKEKVVQPRSVRESMKLAIKKIKDFFFPLKTCSNENCVISISDVARQLYNAWDAPKQTNWITNWICPFSKDRIAEEYCKVILMNRVSGWVGLSLLALNINTNNKDIVPL